MTTTDTTTEREWPDDYQTTKHRGPDPFPVPGEWVLRAVEADGTLWGRYTDAEDASEAGHNSDLDPDVTYEGPDDTASLSFSYEELGSGFDAEVEGIEEFQINGVTVFESRETNRDDLYGTVAEALHRFDRGESAEDLTDLHPTGGEDGASERSDTNTREEENASLGEWK